MCHTSSIGPVDCDLTSTFSELERQLDVLAPGAGWDAWLDVLVVVHRLTPSALREHLAQQGRVGTWPTVEALRLNLRRLAGEDEPMPGAERAQRLRQVGGQLLSALQG